MPRQRRNFSGAERIAILREHLIEQVPIQSTRTCSRRHAIKVFATVAGGTILGGRAARGWAGVPWGEDRSSQPLSPDTQPLGLGEARPYESQIQQNYPTLALEPGGARLWTTWTRAHDGMEGIWLRSFSTRTNTWDDVLPASAPESSAAGTAHQSEIVFLADKLVTVWTEFTAGGWMLLARSFDPDEGKFGAIHRLAGSHDGAELHTKPAVASHGDGALVVWQSKRARKDTFVILARMVGPDGEPSGDIIEVAADGTRDCCRPAVAATPNGRGFAIAFDRQDRPGDQNVYVVLFDGTTGARSEPILVSEHPATDLSPAVTHSPDGRLLWVAWHSNRTGPDGGDIPRWYRLRALRIQDRTWFRPAGDKITGDLDQRGTEQGFELVRLAVSPSGTVCVLGRPSHNFCLQYYSRDGQSPVYRLPNDGWGGRGRWLRGVFDAKGALWVTRRDLRANVLHRIDGFDASLGAPVLEPDERPNRESVRTLAGIRSRYEWPGGGDDHDDLQLCFGDIHGHSWQSDGMGEPEESFLRARDVFRDDFHALTDHDRFVGKRITDGQWQEQKDIVAHFDAPGEFVTLFGQEWTTPRTGRPHGWGHFNIFTADPRIPLFDHGEPRYRDLPDVLDAARAYRAIAIPHHIGWTGVRWDVWDAEVVPAVEICSVHGAFEYEGNEPIRHRGGVKGCFVRDGLAAGLRFGIVGGSDQHGLIWHHGVCWKRDAYRAGLTGVWAAELTRAAVLDAIRARRTFATSGVKLCMRFTLNGRVMGSFVETQEPPSIRVDVAIPPAEGRLGWLQIVRDGAVIHEYGGEGQRSRYVFVDERCPAAATSYYYLRVILTDRNMAWSSPIWVLRS